MPATLDTAFAALPSYDQGSSRASLLPLDAAVVAALPDAAARLALERRLVATLATVGSAVAHEYICNKLALLGSELSLPVLAALLDRPALATAARNALEASPHPLASQVLRDRLPQLTGLAQVGAIQSLGVRRDPASVPALATLLAAPAPEVSRAAVTALGEIGTPAAAKALRDFQGRAPAALHATLADACLVCAERLLAAGQRSEAQSLYRLLSTPTQPKHVQLAAARGLAATPKS
jgi:HEAT repeat protein